MKALLSIRAGGPDTLVLTEVDDPRPGPGEVLISVRACGVNYPDLLIIEGRASCSGQGRHSVWLTRRSHLTGRQ